MNTFKKLALAAAITATTATAQAGIAWQGGLVNFEDDDIEYIRQESTSTTIGNIITDPSATLQLHNELWAVAEWPTIKDGSNNIIQTLPPGEVTAISAIEITGISLDGNTFTFGPSAYFESIYGTGAMIALYYSDTENLNMGTCPGTGTGGVGTCESQATDGTHILTLGLSDLDDFWISQGLLPGVPSGSATLGLVSILDANTKVAGANYALSILYNNTGVQFAEKFSALSLLYGSGGNGYTDVIGSGDVLGGNGLGGRGNNPLSVSNPWVARSDFDLGFNVIPEPASLSLLGLGLVGLGFATRRRKMA